MEKIEKFFRRLPQKERSHVTQVILPKLARGDLSGLQIKKLTGYSLWRIRYKRIRILCARVDQKMFVVKIGFRKDVYRNLELLSHP